MRVTVTVTTKLGRSYMRSMRMRNSNWTTKNLCSTAPRSQKLAYPIRLLEIYVTSRYRGMCMCEVSTGKQDRLRAARCRGKIAMNVCELVDHFLLVVVCIIRSTFVTSVSVYGKVRMRVFKRLRSLHSTGTIP